MCVMAQETQSRLLIGSPIEFLHAVTVQFLHQTIPYLMARTLLFLSCSLVAGKRKKRKKKQRKAKKKKKNRTRKAKKSHMVFCPYLKTTTVLCSIDAQPFTVPKCDPALAEEGPFIPEATAYLYSLYLLTTLPSCRSGQPTNLPVSHVAPGGSTVGPRKRKEVDRSVIIDRQLACPLALFQLPR